MRKCSDRTPTADFCGLCPLSPPQKFKTQTRAQFSATQLHIAAVYCRRCFGWLRRTTTLQLVCVSQSPDQPLELRPYCEVPQFSSLWCIYGVLSITTSWCAKSFGTGRMAKTDRAENTRPVLGRASSTCLPNPFFSPDTRPHLSPLTRSPG